MEEEGERGKGKICRREQGDGREDAGSWQGTKRRKSGGGMRVDGKFGWTPFHKLKRRVWGKGEG